MGHWVRRILLSCLLLPVMGLAQACESVPGVPASLSGGVYCLNFDVGVGGQAAFQLGSDTVLDCNGHSISDLSSTGNAVVANGANITLKNCVFNGFHYPIQFGSTSSYRILNNRINGAKTRSISVTNGTEGLIARNVIAGPQQGDGHYWAMTIYGTADVVQNTILSAEAPVYTQYGARYGIQVKNNLGGHISQNVIRNVLPTSGEQGAALWVEGGYSIIHGNTIVAEPGRGDLGMFCYGAAETHVANINLGYSRNGGTCRD